MKKLFLSTIVLLCGIFSFGQAGTADRLVAAEDMLSYHVNSNGNEYDFIVGVKQLNPRFSNPIIFGWKMTEPVNKSGTIMISAAAVTGSNAFYNWFSGGEKQLNSETSVFISDDLNKLLRAAAKGMTVQIRAHGVASGNQDFTVEDDAQDYSFMQNGKEKTIKVVALKDKISGDELKIYCSPQNAFIVSMSIGFDISLKSIENK